MKDMLIFGPCQQQAFLQRGPKEHSKTVILQPLALTLPPAAELLLSIFEEFTTSTFDAAAARTPK